MSLISVGDLADRIDTVRVCDVRWYLGDPDRGRREYLAGHIPGAVFVDLETRLSGPAGPGRHPLPTPGEFVADLGRWGITPDTPVVAYDSAGGAYAARLWWMLRSIGHEPVAVLDGGLQAWIESGRSLSRETPILDPTDYPVPPGWTGVVGREVVVAGEATLIDARAKERYRGEIEPVDPRAGHIPGAINLPYTGNLDPAGRFLSAEMLATRFGGVGPEPIVYCGSGVTACHNLLAMELAGIGDALLYEGSWSDWSSHPDLPIEIGQGPS